MKVIGLSKGYLYALLFFVLPVGGLLIYEKKQESGAHSIMRSFDKNGLIVLDDNCTSVSNFDDYLKKLNEINKPRNVVCLFVEDVTTTIKRIECEVLHGPPVATIYWAENLIECQKIESNFKKNKDKYNK